MQYVYLLREGQDYYKVGISHNVRSRVTQLQYHVPNKIEIICTKFLDTKAYEAEQELHKWLQEFKTAGANEWFQLTPSKALELCIKINSYPEIDISERVTLATLASNVKRNQKLIERKLDYVINVYQKDIKKPFVTYFIDEGKPEVKEHPVIEHVDKKAEKEKEEMQLFNRILEYLVTERKASTSMLQRKFSIGYGRAARLIDKLEEQGIVSPPDGSYPRTVYIEKARQLVEA